MRNFAVKTGTFLFCLVFAALAVSLPYGVFADTYGNNFTFNIDKTYDLTGRAKLSATLVWVGGRIYFYVDDQWWNSLAAGDKVKYSAAFQSLDTEFHNNISPKLTSLWGTDVNPVVNKDGKITVLVHPMIKDAGGYINTGDGYTKNQVPASNEREMVYFNTKFVDAALAKAYLAHEFTHLITFNQKDRLRGVTDEVWANEARADYSSTVLGYDNPYAGSNFEQRVKSFSGDTTKSLVEWANKPANYGAAHLFMQYVVDQYGTGVIADTMLTEKTGIDSFNYALRKNGHNIDFIQVFRNWLVALAANDCRLGGQYCYKFTGLKNYNVAPRINFLPSSDQVSLGVTYNADYFSGSWQKIVGGGGNLTLTFAGGPEAGFMVPYMLCSTDNQNCKVGDLAVGGDGKANLSLPDFGKQYASLMLMPFAAGKTSRFGSNGSGGHLLYSLQVTLAQPSAGQNDQDLQAKLLAQIDYLKKEIARLRALLLAKLAVATANVNYSCKQVTADLYFGIENYNQVYCLQQILKNEGMAVTLNGRYSEETKAAVTKFQEKYAAAILTPYGYKNGTGYVGPATRKKLNEILSQ
ncbi:MAG: peptidoglycan-binding protein [Candidatus Pacebacteria bacterium]|jgi:hypothetical protein|nr:peptidoglycan-binding protein [Candidatus Paceibacterota bacterium]